MGWLVTQSQTFWSAKSNGPLRSTAACKASLKANTYLTTLDMEVIIKDLFNCEDPYTCPHGRPTMVKYSKYELEKFFKR